MSWQPNSSHDMARARAQMLKAARSYFETRNVLEVSTPALMARTSTDPNIHSVVANLSGRQLYLHTSPEHFMKRLLAADYPDIYQICSVYRDSESGRHHLPEFTMIEWYRRAFELRPMMLDTVALVGSVLRRKKLIQPPLMISYTEAFRDALSLDPLSVDLDVLAEAVNADPEMVRLLGNDRDAWLDLAMATRVVSSFPIDRLTLIYHYPASQAALARLCPDNPAVADRFELYWGTIELANGFVELTDADEQRKRFEFDREKRKARALEPYEIDNNLIDALESGMPATAGVALGLDRLLMIDEGQHDIRSVVSFTPGT